MPDGCADAHACRHAESPVAHALMHASSARQSALPPHALSSLQHDAARQVLHVGVDVMLSEQVPPLLLPPLLLPPLLLLLLVPPLE